MAPNDIYIGCLLAFGLLILIASFDDLIVDALVILKLKKPRIPVFKPPRRKKSKRLKPKIAVCIANWQEDNVLKQMVEGNLKNLNYENFQIVLGVYPNDVATVRIAEALAKAHPEHVKVVVNRRNGPTSKGQMLNEIFANLFFDKEAAPHLVVIHDSEDMIAPASFDLYASLSRDYAMIQIPVFSLDSRDRSLVAATYMEEFAERHTREMLLRSEVGAFVPSAGVGTCIRSDLIQHFLNKRARVLRPDSITEDYILGSEACVDGFKTTFAAFRDPSRPDKPIIATLEYFPKDLWASIRQKTRWVYGISIESTAKLGWFKNGWNLFFQYRDRKGALTNILPVASLFLMIAGLILRPDTSQLGPFMTVALFFVLVANTLNIFIRIFIKALAFRETYGEYNVLGILVRWPVAMFVNGFAVLRAWKMFIGESKFASRQVSWAKTTHEVPMAFDAVTVSGARLKPALAAASRRRWQVSQTHVAYSAAIGFIALTVGPVWLQSQIPTEQPIIVSDVSRDLTMETIKTPASNSDDILEHEIEAPQIRTSKQALVKSKPNQTISTPESLRHYLTDAAHTKLEDRVRKNLIRIAAADEIIAARAALYHVKEIQDDDVEIKPDRPPTYSYTKIKKGVASSSADALESAQKSLSSSAARDNHILNYYRLGVETKKSWRQIIKTKAELAIQKSIAEDQNIQTFGQLARKSQQTQYEQKQIKLAVHTGVLNDAQRWHVVVSTKSSLYAGMHDDEALLRRIKLGAHSNNDAHLLARDLKTDRDHVNVAAKASIWASLRTDEALIARMQTVDGKPSDRDEADTKSPPTRQSEPSIRDLVLQYGRQLTSDKIEAIQNHNQQILSKALGEQGQDVQKEGRPETRLEQLVRSAQQRVNAWLRKNKLTIHDVELGAGKRRACGKYLCIDGILGERTISAIREIDQRAPAFLRQNERLSLPRHGVQ